jgi:hypothetical protein
MPKHREWYIVLKFCDHSLSLIILSLSDVSQSSLKDFSNSRIAILLQSKYIRCPSQGTHILFYKIAIVSKIS